MQGGQGFGGLRQPMGNPAMRAPGVYNMRGQQRFPMGTQGPGAPVQQFPMGDQGPGAQVGMTKPAVAPGQFMQPRMMDTGSMLPQNPMLAAYAQSNGTPYSNQSSGGGFGPPPGYPQYQPPQGLPPNAQIQQAMLLGKMPRTGTSIDDYLSPGTQDGVPYGFTGTMNGRNYVNGNAYAPEYMSQGTDPNTPSFAFNNFLQGQWNPRINGLLGR